MPQNARLTDVWGGKCLLCMATSGVIVGSSMDRFVNNLGQARFSDVTVCPLGHPGIIVGGSTTANTNGLMDARISDAVATVNIGVIVSGSPDHLTGG